MHATGGLPLGRCAGSAKKNCRYFVKSCCYSRPSSGSLFSVFCFFREPVMALAELRSRLRLGCRASFGLTLSGGLFHARCCFAAVSFSVDFPFSETPVAECGCFSHRRQLVLPAKSRRTPRLDAPCLVLCGV